ncbi:hypothetical protein QTP70_007288 [Hemibagrus guttatus]|uniref:Uncharacterized protein n=1 Tax=Hemibagrus guttatus TaxID=175788 RepID=A0AAE0R4D3_9TELE|nr:hypothetical protein QTP70_007288 [Hemibagrus guttatus]
MHESTDYAPIYLMLGRILKLPVDVMFGNVERDCDIVDYDKYVKRSGKSNKNADALSRQNPPESGVMGGLIPGAAVLASLQQVVEAVSVVKRDSSKVAPVEGLVEPSGASSQEEEEEEVDLVGVIPVGGQVVLSAVSETSVVPLPTNPPSSDVLCDPIFIEPGKVNRSAVGRMSNGSPLHS